MVAFGEDGAVFEHREARLVPELEPRPLVPTLAAAAAVVASGREVQPF